MRVSYQNDWDVNREFHFLPQVTWCGQDDMKGLDISWFHFRWLIEASDDNQFIDKMYEKYNDSVNALKQSK